MARMVQPLRVTSRAAQILMASGRPGAGVEQLGGGLGFGRGPLLAHHLDEQLQRLVVVEHVQIDQLGAGQVGHPAPRRDQHRGRRGARQQRPDLRRVARVVQHHQHPAAGQRGPVPGRALVLVHRDVPAVHPEVTQEPGQHVPGRERGRGRAEQVDVELAVGEPAANPVRGVHGQRGLAEAARAGHHRDADRAGIAARARPRQQVGQALHLLVAAGEIGDVGGQLRRAARGTSTAAACPRPGRARGVWGTGSPPRSGSPGGASPRDKHSAGRGRGVLGQQFGVKLAQFGAGVDAQLLGDGVSCLSVDLERLGVPPGAVQGAHQQQPQALPQRMVHQQPAQLRDGLVVAAEGEFGRDAQFGGTEAEFREPFGLRLGQRGRRDVGQRTAVPQGEGLGQPAGRPRRVPGGERPPAVPHHRLEQQRVGVVRGHPELVAGGAGDQQLPVGVVHQAAQPQHVDADQVGRPGRRVVPPYLADQRVGRDDLPGVDQQRRQHGTPLGRPDPPPVFPGPDLNRSEQTEPHHYPGSLASG